MLGTPARQKRVSYGAPALQRCNFSSVALAGQVFDRNQSKYFSFRGSQQCHRRVAYFHSYVIMPSCESARQEHNKNRGLYAENNEKAYPDGSM